jgi:glycosyltransferase involved in cell wall biosynthesis
VVIGTGQDEARLRALAGPTVLFLGWQPDEVIRDQLRRCRALLFPGEEDFGIVPVEAQACGAPVLAFGRGGATETVVPPGGRREPTGLWFSEPTVESLRQAMTTFEVHTGDFSPRAARRQALRFNRERFREELFAYLDAVLYGTAEPMRRAA